MPTYDPLAYEAGMIEDKFKPNPVNFGAGLTGAVQASETVRSGLDKYEGDQKAQMFEQLLEQRVPGFMAALEQAKKEGYDVSQIEPLTGMMFADGNPDNLVKMYGLLSNTVTKQKMAKQIAAGETRGAMATAATSPDVTTKDATAFGTAIDELEETAKKNRETADAADRKLTLEEQEATQKQETYLRTTKNGKMFLDFFDSKDPKYVKTTPIKTILADLTSAGIDITKDQTLVDALIRISGQEAAIAAAKSREGNKDRVPAQTVSSEMKALKPAARLFSSVLAVDAALKLNGEPNGIRAAETSALDSFETGKKWLSKFVAQTPQASALRTQILKMITEERNQLYGSALTDAERMAFDELTGNTPIIRDPINILSGLRKILASLDQNLVSSSPVIEKQLTQQGLFTRPVFSKWQAGELDPLDIPSIRSTIGENTIRMVPAYKSKKFKNFNPSSLYSDVPDPVQDPMDEDNQTNDLFEAD